MLRCEPMDPIPEDLVARVVGETSERMASDPTYTQLAVGSFVQSQPDVSRYITANTETLGGEGVIHAVFHAEVMADCFRRHLDQPVPPVSFAALDAAASGGGEAVARFREVQPALSGYLDSNVDEQSVREVLALIGLAFDGSARG